MIGVHKHILAFAFDSSIAFTGVQIGRAVLTEEIKWQDSAGHEAFDLLPPNTAFLAVDHPELALLYPGLVTPNPTKPIGSTIGFKIAGDLT